MIAQKLVSAKEKEKELKEKHAKFNIDFRNQAMPASN